VAWVINFRECPVSAKVGTARIVELVAGIGLVQIHLRLHQIDPDLHPKEIPSCQRIPIRRFADDTAAAAGAIVGRCRQLYEQDEVRSMVDSVNT